MIFLDSNIYLNVIRANEEKEFFSGSKKILELVQAGKISAATSVLTVNEIKWVLYKKGEELKADAALYFMESLNNHELIPLVLSMAKLGTKLQIEYGLKSHDAFQLATALVLRASAFITRDEELLRLGDIPILTPEQFLKANK